MYHINIITGTKLKCPQITCFTKPAASEIIIIIIIINLYSAIMPLGGYIGAVHLQRTHLGRPCISQAEVTFSLNVVSNTHRVTSNINKKDNKTKRINS